MKEQTRDAAIERIGLEYENDLDEQRAWTNLVNGLYDAGAASVSRREVVEQAFTAFKIELGSPEGFGEGCEYFGFSVQEAIDTVLAEMEKNQ